MILECSKIAFTEGKEGIRQKKNYDKYIERIFSTSCPRWVWKLNWLCEQSQSLSGGWSCCICEVGAEIHMVLLHFCSLGRNSYGLVAFVKSGQKSIWSSCICKVGAEIHLVILHFWSRVRPLNLELWPIPMCRARGLCFWHCGPLHPSQLRQNYSS